MVLVVWFGWWSRERGREEEGREDVGVPGGVVAAPARAPVDRCCDRVERLPLSRRINNKREYYQFL
jgi:hypothetical protein